ncbi:MAG: hypothetical protein WD038_06490 [Balneolales bacterium]
MQVRQAWTLAEAGATAISSIGNTRMVSVMRVHHVETQNLASLRWVKPTMPEGYGCRRNGFRDVLVFMVFIVYMVFIVETRHALPLLPRGMVRQN